MKWQLRNLFITLPTVLFSVVVYAGSGNGVPVEQVNIGKHSLTPVELRCLSDSDIAAIKASGSIDLAYIRCKGELNQVLGKEFEFAGESARKAIFTTAVSSKFAEYGLSDAVALEDISNSATLNCGNLVLLVGYLYGENDGRLQPVGFDGGYVGNHAQLMFIEGGSVKQPGGILLDPTTGVVAKVDFDALLQGKPVDLRNIRTFKLKATLQEVLLLRETVLSGLANGKYKPSDLMYLHGNTREMRERGGWNFYFTPGGIHVRGVAGVEL